MLKKHIEWRIQKQIDDLTFPHSLAPLRRYKCFPDGNAEKAEEIYRKFATVYGWSHHSFTKDGQPLVIVHAGYIDAVSFPKLFPMDQFVFLLAKYIEFVAKCFIPEGASR